MASFIWSLTITWYSGLVCRLGWHLKMPGPDSELLKSKVISRVEWSVALNGWALWATSLMLLSRLGEAMATSSLALFLVSFSLQVNERLSG